MAGSSRGLHSKQDILAALDSEEDFLCSELEDSGSDYESEASEVTDIRSDSEDEVNNLKTDAKQVYYGKDGTEWKSSPPCPQKVRAHNIIKGKINKVVLPPNKFINDPLDCFFLFMSDDVLKSIVKYTNEEAEREYKNRNLKQVWKPTDETEMKCFLGLLYTAGHLKAKHLSVDSLWDRKYGPPIFRAAMSNNRFKHLCIFIRFDDKTTRSVRRQRDKLAPIRYVWEKVNTCLRKYYEPGVNLTVDEQLVPFRGKCPFRQYMPSKPDKYGMKIWWIADSKSFYPLQGIPYTGKEDNKTATNLGHKVVMYLSEPYFRSNRNITCDNYFTSLDLATSLLQNQLTIVGTVRKQRRFIPPEFLPNRARPVESSVFGFQHNFTLVSYVPQRNRSVVLLSSMHHSSNIDTSNKMKPEVILYYNQTKSGVDSLDQLLHEYSCKRKTNRWPFAFFMNLLDVCALAAYVLWCKLHPNWETTNPTRRREFIITMAEGLIQPQIDRRGLVGLQNPIKEAITMFKTIGPCPSADDEIGNPPAKRKRCYLC